MGTGSQGEYLLDFGATTGQYCIDKGDDASHVGCCCGYNPVSLLGIHSLEAPILGLKAEAGPPYKAGRIGDHYQIALGGRKLNTVKEDENAGLDFCAQSWTDNAKDVAKVYDNILQISDGEAILSRDRSKRERYNSDCRTDYCSPFSCKSSSQCTKTNCTKTAIQEFVGLYWTTTSTSTTSTSTTSTSTTSTASTTTKVNEGQTASQNDPTVGVGTTHQDSIASTTAAQTASQNDPKVRVDTTHQDSIASTTAAQAGLSHKVFPLVGTIGACLLLMSIK